MTPEQFDTTEETLETSNAEIDPHAAERRGIMDRTRDKLADVLNHYVVRNVIETGKTFVPGLDVQKFWETAEASSGLKQVRYMAAAGLTAEYWKLLAASDMAASDATFIAAGAAMLIRVPEIIESLKEYPATARLIEAAAILLSDQKEKLQALWGQFATFAKTSMSHGS